MPVGPWESYKTATYNLVFNFSFIILKLTLEAGQGVQLNHADLFI